MEQCRLPRAGRARDGSEAARREAEREVAEHLDRMRPAPVHLRDREGLGDDGTRGRPLGRGDERRLAHVDAHQDAAGRGLEACTRRVADELLGKPDPAAAVDHRLDGATRPAFAADTAVADLHDAVGDARGVLIVTDDEVVTATRARARG